MTLGSAAHCAHRPLLTGQWAKQGSTLETRQSLPVLGSIAGKVKSVCILILWALVPSSVHGRGWVLFLWILPTFSSIPLYFCWVLSCSSPTFHQSQELDHAKMLKTSLHRKAFLPKNVIVECPALWPLDCTSNDCYCH